MIERKDFRTNGAKIMRGMFSHWSLMVATLLLAAGTQISSGQARQNFNQLVEVMEKESTTEGISLLGKGPQIVELEKIVQAADEAAAEAADPSPASKPAPEPPAAAGSDTAPAAPSDTSPLGQSTRENSEKKPNEKKVDPESLEGLKKRYHDVQTEIVRKTKQPGPKEPKDDELVIVLENPHLSRGRYRGNNEYDRSFVVRVLFANPTDKDMELKRQGVTLKSDEKTYQVPDNLNDYHDSYIVGGKHYSLSSLKMPEVVKIPAGKTASTWVAFGKLPMNPAVPDLTLTLDFGGKKREIDVNEFCGGLLKLRTERLGPKNCLAVITIAGKLDPVNVRDLVDRLDDLTVKQKLARVIVRWEEDASAVENDLMNWLEESAKHAGQPQPTNRNDRDPHPVVPMSIRELHLAEIPKENGTPSSSERARIHKTFEEAVISALRTAYKALSADEIVDDLRHKNPTIRAAALMGGGGRLPPEKLPVLLEFVKSGNRNLERAAIFALRNFGEDRAIETLIELVKKNEKPRCTEAAESLATSRFAAASDALLELLKTAKPEVKTNIVQVLAKYPRPIWAETIAEYAEHPEKPIGMAALKALNGIGHPELLDLLKNALEQNDEKVQMEAFNMLAGRKDQASEELALEYTLKHLRSDPPVGQMASLIIRTKEPRAIPLLMRQFQNKKGSRSTLINTLAQIGDQSVVDLLVSEYPKMDDREKRYVLQGLEQLHSPEFLRLAEKALGSKHSSLLNTATDGLAKEGSPRAEQALINALKKEIDHSYWRYVCNALVNFGTPEARAALREARDSENSSKKSAAISALRNMQQRSPGRQYVYQAKNYVKQEKYDLAIRYYNLCLEADSEYAEGYAGRGNVYLRQKKYKKAKADFEKGVQADPENTQAHAGLAIMKILEGQVDEGVRHIESAQKKFAKYESDKGTMHYKIACVYGRAVEQLKEAPAGDDRDKKLKKYQSKAVEQLQTAVKNRFNDFDLMEKDPDLKAVAELPGFQKILPQPNKKEKRNRPNLGIQPGVF